MTPVPDPLPQLVVFRPNVRLLKRCVVCALPIHPQDFPYNLEDGIEHYNLWATYPLQPHEVTSHVATHLGGSHEWMVFENPPSLMSVPSVRGLCAAVDALQCAPQHQMWHVHVLARRQEKLDTQSV